MSCPVCHAAGNADPPRWLVSPFDRQVHAFWGFADNMADTACGRTAFVHELGEDHGEPKCTGCVLIVGTGTAAHLDRVGTDVNAHQMRGMN